MKHLREIQHRLIRERPHAKRTVKSGPGCPHSKHGSPAQCSMCLNVKATRVSAVDPTKKFAYGLTPLQKLAALDALIGEDPEPSVAIEVEPEDDLFVPPS